MSNFKIGNIVVLTAGSMRMVVEKIDGEKISTVWCNEGIIGRDKFVAITLKKWEHREEDKTRIARNSSRNNERNDYRETKREDRQKVKTGWDGKPREKKFFRKN